MSIIYTREIRELVALSEKDAAIDSAKAELDSIPEKISDLEKSLSEKEAAWEEAKKEMTRLMVAGKEIEISVSEKEEKLAKRRRELNGVKSNEVYRVMLKEIEDMRRSIDESETEELRLLEDVDAAGRKRKKLEEDLKTARTGLSDATADLRGREARLKSVLEKEQEERRRISEKLDADLLERYEYIRKKRGFALARVRFENEKYYCDGCHMALTSGKSGELKKENVVAICDNCQRMLYLDENAGKNGEKKKT